MGEENKIRDRINCKACDALEAIRQNNAVATVHLRTNDRLLASNIRPEE